jgi:PcfJ-like protein
MGHAVVSANAGARLVALETQIKRFDRSYRRRLRKFTRTSSRHGDLLFTFPAIAFALVSGRGTIEQRGEAARLVRDGAPLAEIAAILKLPQWMRRLPPEAFQRPVGDVATGVAFGRKIVGRLPKEASEAANWLQAHEVACANADEHFAYWLAGQHIYADLFSGGVPVRPLAIFAWYSGKKDVRGSRLMVKPWNKQMQFKAAVLQMSAWYDRVVTDLCRYDTRRGPGRYSRRKRGNGYSMVPLRSAAELDEEGQIMENCVGSYSGMVAERECLIYSVRRGSTRVATLEVRGERDMRGSPRIAQLEGPGNTRAAPVIWTAVNNWLAEQDPSFLGHTASIAFDSVDATRWKALWMPYVSAKGTKMLSLERPDHRQLSGLLADAERLVTGVCR